MNEQNSREKIQEVIDILNKQDERLQRIENGLTGDNEMGSSGLVNRYEITEALALDNKKSIERIMITASTITIAVSLIFQLIVLGVQYVF